VQYFSFSLVSVYNNHIILLHVTLKSFSLFLNNCLWYERLVYRTHEVVTKSMEDVSWDSISV
jgi:hypothetical protein